MSKQYFVFFKNSIDAYNLLQKLDKIEKTLAPTPREASHCCGVCIIIKMKKTAHILRKWPLKSVSNLTAFGKEMRISIRTE